MNRRSRLGRVVRIALLAAGVALGAVVLLVVAVAAYALVAPYSSVPVSAACTGPAVAATAARRVSVPGVGDGTLVATDGTTEVVVTPPAGQGSAGGSVYVVASGRVVGRLTLRSPAVAAAVEDGIVYLFDDKLGWLLDATTGSPLPRLFESDNYRGLYTAGDVEYLQTNAEFTAIGLAGSPFFTRTIDFGAVAHGCVVAGLPSVPGVGAALA